MTLLVGACGTDKREYVCSLEDGYVDKLRAGLKLAEAQLLAPPTDPCQEFFNRNRQWRTM